MILVFIMQNGNSKKETFFAMVNIVLPIIIGGFIYVAWRKETLLMFSWLRYLGLEVIVLHFRIYMNQFHGQVPKFILYCLPDGLWVYSLTFFMGWLWKDGSKRALIFWLGIGPVLGIGGELGQLFGLVQGHFDFLDLFACSVAALSAGYFIQIHKYLRQEKLVRINILN